MSQGRSFVGPRRYLPGPGGSVAFVAALVFLATALSALAPRLDVSYPRASVAVRAVYSKVCHQLSSRSLGTAQHPHALCARCEGLYCGGAIALALAACAKTLRVRYVNRWLLLLFAPTAVDVLIRVVGGMGLDSFARFLVALPAGFAAGALLAVGVADCSLILAQSRVNGRPGPPSRARLLAENPHE